MSDQPNAPTKFYFIVPVWGRAFCELFTSISLPSQMSSNNIPNIKNIKSCHYHIITTKNDMDFIKSSASYKRLSKVLNVKISTYNSDLSVPHDAMSDCYRIGIEEANKREAAIVFLTPDLIWSDGSFTELERISENGSRVVHTLGLRLLKETFVPLVARKYLSADGATLCIPSRDLVQLALHHLHPIAKSHLWEDGGDNLVPANLYWRVDEEGLLARCFHLHPLMVNPSQKNIHFHGTVDDDFVFAACPDSTQDYVVLDSDKLLACEISAQGHTVNTSLRKGVVADIAAWAEGAANTRHRELVLHPIRFHATAMSEDKWRAVEVRSGAVVRAALDLLDRPSLLLLATRPKIFIKRIVRIAQDTRVKYQNNPEQKNIFILGGVETILVAYKRYVSLCRAYTELRSALNNLLFGPDSAPYPWHPLWVTHRVLWPHISPLLQGRDGSLLLVSEGDGPLASSMEKIIRRVWPGKIVSARLSDVIETSKRLQPGHDDGSYEAVVCLLNDKTGDRSAIGEACVQLTANEGLTVLCGRLSHPVSTNAPPSGVTRYVFGKTGTAFMTATCSVALHRVFTWRPSPVIIEAVLLAPILLICALLGAATSLMAILLDSLDLRRQPNAFHISTYTAITPPANQGP